MSSREAPACASSDLVRGWSGVWLWCVPVAALFASAPMGDARAWVWCPALVLMGAACLVNAARCGRRHCYLTGPLFLIAALFSLLQATRILPIGWNWILGMPFAGWAAGCLLERAAGSYVQDHSSEP